MRNWARTAATADDACVVLDGDGMIVASSQSCRDLLGTDGRLLPGNPPQDWSGRGLLDVLRLVDLTAAGAPLAAWEAERIPPLLALATGNLARGLIRVRLGDLTRTVDVVSTPLSGGEAAAGSLSFFRRI
jgi:PAS domain-containing protein